MDELTEAKATETAVIPTAQSPSALTVFARNPQEMSIAQAQLVTWATNKLAEVCRDHAALEENLEIARKGGWATTTLARQVAKAQKRIEFYEKVKAALEAGYCIVPGFPIDVFAVRTEHSGPKGEATKIDTPPLWSPAISDQQSESPSLGEGAYVSPTTVNMEERETLAPVAGKPQQTRITVWAEAFREVDFPFAFAQPAVLSATQQAMAARIFDELGVSPARTQSRRGDPMVIGRIYAPRTNRWQRDSKSLSFVVAWFLRPDRDLNF